MGIMTTTIRLSDDTIAMAKRYAKVEHRSTAKQIEWWAKVGRTAIDNPDLPVPFIIEVLHAMEEAKDGAVTPFEFDT